jgi:DNA-binding IclR family transcriptional regulator
MQQAVDTAASPPARIQPVDRALRLLKAVAESRTPPTLPALAAAADVNPSTAWRLLATLQDHGFVARSRGGYVVGYATVRVAAAADERVLARTARPLLERLADETQEAVSLSVPQHRTIVSIDHVAGPRVVSAGWVGEHLPLHCTSNGKLLLASWPDEELAAFVAEPLAALTPRTITEPAALLEELGRIRRRAFGVEVEEFEVGLHAVSAAARDARGAPIATLSASGPAYRIPPGRLDELGARLLDAVAVLERRLA